MHSLTLISSTLLLFGLFMVNNARIADPLPATWEQNYRPNKPKISMVSGDDDIRDRNNQYPSAVKRKPITSTNARSEGNQERVCGKFIYDSATHECQNGQIIPRNEDNDNQGTGEKPKFLPFLAGAAAGTILDKLSGKTNTVSANDDNENDETEENPKFLPYSPYTPIGGQMDKLPRKTNMVSGSDEYQTEETGEKPKFLPFLAGAAAGTILDKLSGKTNTVSANGGYQSDDGNQQEENPSYGSYSRTRQNSQSKSKGNPAMTRRCATTRKGIKLCQCGPKKELYNAKKSFCCNGQVINRFDSKENQYSNKNDDGSTQTKGLREAALIGGIPAVAHLIGKAIDKKD